MDQNNNINLNNNMNNNPLSLELLAEVSTILPLTTATTTIEASTNAIYWNH